MHISENLSIPSDQTDDVASSISWPMMAVRTVLLPERRVRLRLEAAVWDGLDAIAAQEMRPVWDLCGDLEAARSANITLASAIRTYVLDYFRQSERR